MSGFEHGMAHYLADRFDDARRAWERAFRELRAAGELRAASRVAGSLSELHYSLGNQAAARGWVERGKRVLADVGPCVERGYIELALVACDRDDIDELLVAADRALALAVEFDDGDLEVLALADAGFGLVAAGRTPEGFARLDEALAAITTGAVTDAWVVGRSFCSLLSACDRAGDIGRAEEWKRIVDEMVLDPGGGEPRILWTHCRVAYGSVLCTVGRWQEAEEVIGRVLGPEGSPSIGHRIDALARLAELRLHQGRVEEAAAMLAPWEERVAVAIPLARVHLARGDQGLALAVARRGLSRLVSDVLRRAPLLAVTVDAALASGDVDAAAEASAELDRLAGTDGGNQLAAMAALAHGRVAGARGEHEAAVEAFGVAIGFAAASARPLLEGEARLALAEALGVGDDATAAAAEARGALAVFERLGAARLCDRAAAVVRSFGGAPRVSARSARDRIAALTPRETEIVELIRAGATNAEIGRRLYLSPKTVENHVSRILVKLGVRSRVEAGVLAAAAAIGG